MIMPNFIQLLNVFISTGWVAAIFKDITGKIQRIDKEVGNSLWVNTYLNEIYENATLGDYSIDTFYNGSYIFLGSGTTVPTKDDYTLEVPYTYASDGLHVVSMAKSYKETYTTNRVYTITVKNNSNEDITVSEIGWFLAWCTDGTTGATPSAYFKNLMAREVFEPVTIKPGETRAFTMSIEM
jgi:hypothetical protein